MKRNDDTLKQVGKCCMPAKPQILSHVYSCQATDAKCLLQCTNPKYSGSVYTNDFCETDNSSDARRYYAQFNDTIAVLRINETAAAAVVH